MRGVLSELPANVDIVVTARNAAASSDLRLLQEDIRTLVKRAGLLAAAPEEQTQ